MSRWLKGVAVVAAIVTGFIVGERSWPLVMSWTGSLALSTRFTASADGLVNSLAVERDFSKRLRSAGRNPASARCQPDLAARQGATTRCEATYKTWGLTSSDIAPEVTWGWLADRAEYLVAGVQGRTVSVDITPGLSQFQLESALSQMLYTATYLDCPKDGVRGKVGETVTCQGTYGYPDGPCQYDRCTLFVTVDGVTGLTMKIRVADVRPPTGR